MSSLTGKLSIIALCCTPSIILAQQTQESAPLQLSQAAPVQFKEITISSAIPGVNQTIQDVQGSIEVIDRQRMDALSIRSVPQLLQYAVGVEMRDRGSTSSVAIRGSSNNQTLLLVDGLRRTGKFGSSDLIGLSAENIERIEIIRGPMSALYGADSIGGVINIITKKSGNEFGGGAYAMGGATGHGERGTIIGRAYLDSGQLLNTRHRLSFEARERDIFRYNRNAPQSDLGEIKQRFLSYNGDWAIRPGRKLSWGMEYTNQDDKSTRFDLSRGLEQEDRAQGRVNYNDANSTRVIDLSLGYGVSDTKVIRTASNLETTNFRRVEGNAFVTFFPLDNLIWTLGAGGRDESIDVNVFTAGRQSRTVYHGMTQAELNWDGNWGRFALLGGVRYDDFSDFGGSVNPRVSGTYGYGQFSLRAGYGHGFVAPAFTSQYITVERSASRPGFVSTTLIYGNPDLKAEKGNTVEVSGAYAFDRGKLEATWHHTDYSNLINSVSVPVVTRNGAVVCQAGRTTIPGEPLPRVLSCNESQNIGQARIQGVEVVLNYNVFDWWRLFTAYEWLDTKDKRTSLRLRGRAADHTVRVQNMFSYLDKLFFSVNLVSQWNYFGQNALRRDVLVDHFNMDIKLDYFFTKQINLFAGIDNITDRVPSDGYSGVTRALDPGARFYYGGISFRF